MFRKINRYTPILSYTFFESKSKYDVIKSGIKNDEPTTGFQRVKTMFSQVESEGLSVELTSVIQTSLTGAFFGACFGGFGHSREAYIYFIESNQATMFDTTLDAKKKLQDHVTVAFAKGAYKWGWRVCIFSGMFSLISTVISVYRDKTSVLEYVVAGTISGAVYKMNLGLAAMLVGAGLGASLSLVGGILVCGLLKVSGLTMTDVRKQFHKIKEFREYHYSQAEDKSAEIKHDNITRHHDQMVMDKGETKIADL